LVFFFKKVRALPTDRLLCIRAGSAGCMLSIAVVHILPEANHVLETKTAYPIAAALFLLGLLLSFMIEVLSGGQSHDHVEPSSQPMHQILSPSDPCPCKLCPCETSTSMQDHPVGVPASIHPKPQLSSSFVMGSRFGAGDEEQESVTAISSSSATVKKIEFGCVAHSIILGITLGLQTEKKNASLLLIVGLLCSLSEALCLSHLLASLHNRCEMFFMFGCTVGGMPFGIIIGLVVWQSANGEWHGTV